jgi:hypothetical protein
MPFDETSMRLTGSQREVQAYLEYRALPFVFASDLYGSATWQDALKRGEDYVYGKRSVSAYEHRPQFELYDLEKDPDELQFGRRWRASRHACIAKAKAAAVSEADGRSVDFEVAARIIRH